MTRGRDEMHLRDAAGIEQWLLRRLTECCEPLEEAVDPRKPFASYGVDSRTALQIVGELEKLLGLDIEATILWDYPTAQQLARHLASQLESSEEESAITP